jgi:Spy/CpxP family protein refolding chaperone
MKKIATTFMAVAGLLSLSQVQAQTAPPAPPPDHHEGWRAMTPEERFNRFSEELNLTEEQKPKVKGVFDEMRQKVQAARTNADSELQGILTPEQYQKMQSMWEQHGHPHMGKGGGSKPSEQ